LHAQEYVERALAQGGRVLVHGALEDVEMRVLAVCAAVVVSVTESDLSSALTRVQQVQGEVVKGSEGRRGLPVWHLKALFEWALEKGKQQSHQSLEEITAVFEHPNTPQEVLETYAWRCGSKPAAAAASEEAAGLGNDLEVEDYPLLYGTSRHQVWYGGHRMVVETVSGGTQQLQAAYSSSSSPHTLVAEDLVQQ
jgi:hypothetical protein